MIPEVDKKYVNKITFQKQSFFEHSSWIPEVVSVASAMPIPYRILLSDWKE